MENGKNFYKNFDESRAISTGTIGAIGTIGTMGAIGNLGIVGTMGMISVRYEPTLVLRVRPVAPR